MEILKSSSRFGLEKAYLRRRVSVKIGVVMADPAAAIVPNHLSVSKL